ncbi:MAG: STAS-like domain-containing protein [Spirochaetales bacterium]|nr:STAS-like domain-containing protein [Spirochaetales bacterium]
MSEIIAINVYQIIGKELCIEAADGKIVYNVLEKYIESDQKVTVSFQNITLITSSFLNNAVGLLLKNNTEEKIRELIEFKDLQPADKILMDHVIENAKLYYSDTERMEKLAKEIMEEE